MMKRFLFLVTLLLITISCTMPAFADSPQDGILSLLDELQIMQGDPDGNLRLDDAVTRSEFTKAAVASSTYRNSVASHLSISPFPDVTYRHWAAPYVRVGVTSGLISGYPDATFRPDAGVLFEEGVTIMLRILGYTDADFGVSWPYGQLGLADNLDMTDDIDCRAGQVMNRGQVAQLIANTLRTKMKGQNTQLANHFDVQIQEDVTLIADSTDDPSIASDEVFTTYGILKTDSPFARSLLGLKGAVAIKNNTKAIAFLPDSGDITATDDYVVYSILSDAVMAYHHQTLTQLDIADSTTIYKGKSQTTFGSLKSSLQMGDILRVKKNGTGIDYAIWQKGNLVGPITIRSADWGADLGISHDTSVMRNGETSSYSALQTYDIAYYLKDLNLVLAYSDKVTGVFEKATPNKDMPSSVTISGKEYHLESGVAFRKLASGGNFLLGDTITALLGRNGEIADVISPTAKNGEEIVGYVLESGRKTFQSGTNGTYTAYYIKLVLPSGETGEYTTDKNYSTAKNKVVKVTFSGGNAKVSALNSTGRGSLGGIFDWNNRKFGTYTVAVGASILDIGTLDTYDSSIYARIFPQRLDQVYISSSQVLYYDLDDNGSLSTLILKNVTNDGFSFGLMTSASNNIHANTVSGTYEYLVNGQFYSLHTNGRTFSPTAGMGIQIGGNPSNPDTLSKLSEISERITSVSASTITTTSRTYPVSGTVSVYQKSSTYSSEYVQIPISDLLDREDYNITAYYDKLPDSGGQVRVIVVY